MTVSESVNEVTLHAKEITIEEASFKSNVDKSVIPVVEIGYHLKNTTVSLEYFYTTIRLNTLHDATRRFDLCLRLPSHLAKESSLLNTEEFSTEIWQDFTSSLFDFIENNLLFSRLLPFFRSSYADANGDKKVMASTQFEALDARR